MNSENWLPLHGFEHRYLISNTGLIKSIFGRNKPGVPFAGSHTKQGYIFTKLRDGNGIGKRLSMHRLLALTFIPNPNGYPQINHKNGVKHDNRLENLEWCTSSMNNQHAYDVLKRKQNGPKGATHPSAKLTDAQVIEIRKSTIKASSIAKTMGVSRRHIYHIRDLTSRKTTTT